MATPMPKPAPGSLPIMSSPLLTSVPTATSVPAVPGLPVLGNLLAFRRDQLALHDAAARTAPLARLQLVHLPIYVATCADLAHQILVDDAAALKK